MASKVRSARGEVVDFDILKIRQQLSNSPTTIEVEKREEVITAKRKRLRKNANKDDVTDEVNDSSDESNEQ